MGVPPRLGGGGFVCAKPTDDLPDLFGRFREIDEVEVLGGDDALVGEGGQVDDAVPEGAADEDDGNPLHLVGLDQRQRLEQLVERAESAGEGDERLGAHEEMHLAQAEVAEAETGFRGVWL
jgi:hypothetical protein